ncbi:MAG: NUDIX domain-containing protein [Devosia sp.]|nr:NUDIX domain-containing protein [Devosia sp.]
MERNINAASVALIDRNKVLLIQRARAPWLGLWSLPGGRLEAGETAEQCAIREVREETGLLVYALRPLMRLEPGGGTNFLLQVFATEGFEGEIVASDEISDHRWVRAGMVGGLETTPHLAEVLERAFRLFDRR